MKKIIYAATAIAVVAILVIGLQIFPKTLAFDFEANPIDAVITTYAADPDNPHIRTVYHPNQAQIDELKSRLESLSGAKKTREFNYTTTMASIEIDLENGDKIALKWREYDSIEKIEHLEGIQKAIITAKSPNSIQILDPDDYSPIDLEMNEKLENHNIGEEIDVIKIEGKIYLL